MLFYFLNKNVNVEKQKINSEKSADTNNNDNNCQKQINQCNLIKDHSISDKKAENFAHPTVTISNYIASEDVIKAEILFCLCHVRKH